ncbi:uncharacterized protein LOC110447209 [Mizuhopecten yessoensis]|uniref:Kyphoscoliosis peptidase n=1 Tax=Mizuhopecten yessoensis TaxID=6573 RepID=A0A210QVW2_MIZYE|nr:uncharacterized protein LOC110447209 [Mizuhopecten yessoensis]OWF52855.1 Kyphoscoliosis peptidase [Mizuhopecten yessoensis]
MGSGQTKKEPEPEPAVEPTQLNARVLRLTMKSLDRFKRSGLIDKEVKKDMSKMPPIQPTKIRRRDIFAPRKMQAVYKRVLSVSKDELLSYNRLIEHLTGRSGSPVESVWSIYLWLVNFDPSSPQLSGSSSVDTPHRDLNDVISGKLDMQLLFNIVCRKLDLPCMLAEGFTKMDRFVPGCLQSEAKFSADHWNYVYLEGEWRFIHPGLGSTAPQKNRSFFFLTDPSNFIHFCFPSETRWQLSEDPVIWKDFSGSPFCKPNFFAMGLIVAKPKTPELKIRNETVVIEISAPSEMMDKILLHYKVTGQKVKEFVEKEDTISNDSLPISPYQSTVDLKEDLSDPAFLLQQMFGNQIFKKPLIRSDGGFGGLAKEQKKTNDSDGDTDGKSLKETDDESPKMNGNLHETNGDVEPEIKAPLMNGGLKKALMKQGLPDEDEKKEKNKQSPGSINSSKVNLKLKKLPRYSSGIPREEKPSKLVFGSSLVSSKHVPHKAMFTPRNPETIKKMIDNAFKKSETPAHGATEAPYPDKEIDPTKFPTHLERYVYLHYGYSRFIFEIELPVTGVYTCEILGDLINFNDVSPDVTQLESICKFKIEKEGESQTVPALPVVPEVGWGPNPYMAVYGIKPLSHTDGRVFLETGEEMTMQFELFGTIDLHTIKIQTKLRNPNFKSEDLEDKTRHIIVGDTMYVRILLPGKGQFALKLFAKKKGEQGFKNICNYLLIYGKKDVKSPFNEIKDDKYSKRMLRERLQKAILYGNETEIQTALDDFEMHLIPDEGEVKLAKKRLEFFTIQKGLRVAIKRRHPETIKVMLAKGKASDYAPELRNEITEAENTLANLNKLAGFNFHIRKLDRDILAEMKTFIRPKPIVVDVMRVVVILLGEDAEEITGWDKILPHLHKKGADSLLNRIDNLRVGSLNPSILVTVDNILEQYSYKDIRESSTNVAAFHKWIQQVCEKRKAIIAKEEKEMFDRVRGKLKAKSNEIAVDDFMKNMAAW